MHFAKERPPKVIVKVGLNSGHQTGKRPRQQINGPGTGTDLGGGVPPPCALRPAFRLFSSHLSPASRLPPAFFMAVFFWGCPPASYLRWVEPGGGEKSLWEEVGGPPDHSPPPRIEGGSNNTSLPLFSLPLTPPISHPSCAPAGGW